MSFSNNIPDPHLGLYSASVLGKNGDEVNYDPSENWYADSWFVGYYLNNTGASGLPSDGYLTGFGSNYIYTAAFDVSFDYQGWIYNTLLGWCYMSITPLTFDGAEKKLWVWINDFVSDDKWFYFDRYECYKNYILGTSSIEITYGWQYDALANTSQNIDGVTYTLEAGEGIYVYKASGSNNVRSLLKVGVDSSSNKKKFLYQESGNTYSVTHNW